MSSKPKKTNLGANSEKDGGAVWTAKEWLGLGSSRQLDRGEAMTSFLFSGVIGGALAWIFVSFSFALSVFAINIAMGIYREKNRSK